MVASALPTLRFDAFALDRARGVLVRGDSELALRRQSFEVLRYLAEHPGSVVSIDELVDAVWVSKPADPAASVGQCVKEIRRALGDDARWIIKTVSGLGYAFKAEAMSEPAPAGETAPVAPSPKAWPRLTLGAAALVLALAAASSTLRSDLPAPGVGAPTMMAAPTIALLAFTDIGPSSGDKGAAEGFADELRSALDRAHRNYGFTIRSVSDGSERAAGVAEARRLGIRYGVLGATRLDSGIEHAHVRLIELDTDTQLWSGSFDAHLDEPGALARLAARVARLVTYQVASLESHRPLPVSPEAGHYVILGMALVEGERGAKETRAAQAYFEQALALDPECIYALRGWAVVRIDQVRNGWIPREERPDALDQAEVAIDHIIRLDHQNIGGHWLRGFLLRARGDVDHAIAALEHTLSLNPNFSLARAELGRTKIDAGRAREGLEDIEEAIRMSPTDPGMDVRYFWAGMAAEHLADHQTALAWLLKARQADRQYLITMQWLAVAYLGIGDEEKAAAIMDEYRRASPGFTIAGWRRSLPSSNPVVAAQRQRIEAAFRRLGVPEGT